MQVIYANSIRVRQSANAASDVRVLVHTASHKAACSLLFGSSGLMFVSALYLMKSACGIDLMAGPSPLHHIFF